jgi:outer membrane lipoprotein SlyB
MIHAHALSLLVAVFATVSMLAMPLLALAQSTPQSTPVTTTIPASPVPASSGPCDRCGKVDSIREVPNKDQWTPLGTVATPQSDLGARGVAVYQVGPGFSNQGQVLVGAAGGTTYQTRAKPRGGSRYEIVVKMDDGSSRSVLQNYEPLLVVGDRVRVLGTQVELVQ